MTRVGDHGFLAEFSESECIKNPKKNSDDYCRDERAPNDHRSFHFLLVVRDTAHDLTCLAVDQNGMRLAVNTEGHEPYRKHRIQIVIRDRGLMHLADDLVRLHLFFHRCFEDLFSSSFYCQIQILVCNVGRVGIESQKIVLVKALHAIKIERFQSRAALIRKDPAAVDREAVDVHESRTADISVLRRTGAHRDLNHCRLLMRRTYDPVRKIDSADVFNLQIFQFHRRERRLIDDRTDRAERLRSRYGKRDDRVRHLFFRDTGEHHIRISAVDACRRGL